MSYPGTVVTVLSSVNAGLRIALDTGSEISIGGIDLLENVRLVRKPVFVEGIGDICIFDKIGDLPLAESHRVTVLAVERGDLPPDFHVLLGTAHLLELGISVDFALRHPESPLKDAMAFGRTLALPTAGLSSGLRPLQSVCSLAICAWAILGALSLLAPLVWFEASPVPLLFSVIEPPRALVWIGITVLLACSLRRLPEALCSPRAPLLSSVRFAPELSRELRTTSQPIPKNFASIFMDKPASPPRLGGRGFREEARGYPQWSASGRVPTGAHPRQHGPFRSRSVPSSRELRLSEKKRRSRVNTRAKVFASRRKPPVARKVDLARPSRGRPPGPRGWTTARPLASPGIPMAESVPQLSHGRTSHIFDLVPGFNLELQREAFAAVASVPEKLQLLSRPRSRQSSHLLTERPLRCFMMQVVHGPRARVGPVPALPLVPRPDWMQETLPYSTKEEADQIWRQGTGTSQEDAPPLSPSSFSGGNTLKVVAEVDHPRTGRCDVRIALDTQSDVTTCVREYLSEIRPIITDVVSGCGVNANFTEEGILRIYSRTQQNCISLPALVAPRHQLPFSCVALLGVPALLQLEVAVDQHLLLPQFSDLVCHLGEKRLREWLEHHPDDAIDTSPFDLESIQINPRLSPERLAQVKAEVLRECSKAIYANSLPKTFATDPITLKFKQDAKPQSVPQPR
jgi:hypothetical protein